MGKNLIGCRVAVYLDLTDDSYPTMGAAVALGEAGVHRMHPFNLRPATINLGKCCKPYHNELRH